MYILGIAVIYNLIYIPYSLAFDFEAQEGGVLWVDIIIILIYFLDIVVNANTAILNK
jgi:hypothetical protein